MFAQINESFKFLKEMMQLLHFFNKCTSGKDFSSPSLLLKNPVMIILNVLFLSTSSPCDSICQHIFICEIKRPENCISKITLSDPWLMLSFVVFVCLFVFLQRLSFPLTSGSRTGKCSDCSTCSCLADCQELC